MGEKVERSILFMGKSVKIVELTKMIHFNQLGAYQGDIKDFLFWFGPGEIV